MKIIRPLSLLVALMLPAFLAQAAPPPPPAATSLRLCHNRDESFPWIMKQMPGFSQMLATETGRRMKVEVRLLPLQWEDCMRALQDGRADGAISAAFSAERTAFAVYPVKAGKPDSALRMYNNSFSLFHRKGEKVTWDGRTLTVKGSVGVRQGSSISVRLKTLGASVDDSSTSYVQLLRSLSKGEFSAAAVETIEGQASLVQDFNLRSALVMNPKPLLKEPFFTIFSKRWAAQNPALMAEFWRQQQALKKSPDFLLKVRHLVKTID